MQPITIQFDVGVRKDYTPLHVYLGCVWVVIYVKYITYEGLLHNTLALDVDTVQEACVYSRVRKDYTPLHVYLGCVWVVIYVNYVTYEGLLHNTLALDVDTVQEACIQQTRV